MTLAYLNGEYLPLEQARVPVMDRGFLFGDGVYEVIPVYQGSLFRLDHHLQRLENSLSMIRLKIDVDKTKWRKILEKLIHQNGGGDQSVYLQVTRGPAPTREHAFPSQITPTVLAYSMPLTTPSVETLSKGIAAITFLDTRWKRCDIKAITLLPNVLLRQEAIDKGAQEAILINNGYAIEGTASNLFIVKDKIIITPPTGPQMLGGITRDLVLELADQHHIPCQQTMIPENMLFNANEIWVTSSTKEIVPVVKLNNKPVGNGQAGALWRIMIRHYQDYKSNLKD